ncbi:fructosamine kinase family protein [Curtobacterium sp. MCPF17_002]|uniref:fructosamine kinase family protein n=1 Tax=Curtobacterium sp. MCPF17_002 TaxID=2175645 RepID=UPI000DAA7B88|nr:fructosamine kinase family protein [Curtobacterium sp. MCPF17_002]WIB76895.1 fructosamine kinase family protein [Curtobacterium sp. MCPF17_002]
MAETHQKTFTDPHEAAAEAAGLAWLADAEPTGGTRIARVLGRPSATVLDLERIDDGSPTAAQVERFGRSLAHTHAAGADGWGTPSPGFPTDGVLRMGRSGTPFVAAAEAPATWGEFFAEYRIRDFVRRIVDRGGPDHGFGPDEVALFERVADRVQDGTLGSPQPALVGDRPARLHGDLWAGNVLWPGDHSEPTGAVLIDANPHGGHAETDLALLALFGLPRLETVLSGYDAESRLADGWQERVELHQLAPLLLHVFLFGGSYRGAAVRAARRYA